jgi:hypothetical protein
MKNVLIAIAVFTAAAGAMAATAGMKEVAPVEITPQSGQWAGQMRGALGSTRNSANPDMYLGCMLVITSPPWISCEARDAKGNGAWCSSSDPAMVSAFSSITPSSYLSVNFLDGQCKGLIVRNNSANEPPQ